MKKKHIARMMALGLALTMLAGCGSKPAEAEKTAGNESTQEAADSSEDAKASEAEGAEEKSGDEGTGETPKIDIGLRAGNSYVQACPDINADEHVLAFEERMGVDLDITLIQHDGFTEKLGMMLAQGDFPDVIAGDMPYTSVMSGAIENGLFMPLDDLLEEYGPNLMAQVPENVWDELRGPDGHIYALPAVFTLTAARDDKFWMNKSWLEQVGKEIPETVDELEEVLRSFKGVDFNGNGEADEYPMGVSDASALIRRFAGVWGYQYQFGTYLEVKDGKVSTYLTDDGFKEELQWLAKMYGEGLIDPEIFTQEYAKYAAKMAGQQMGLFFNQADDTFDSSSFEGIAPFKGKADRQYVESAPAARDNGVFAICADCENKEAAMRWIDYFYGYEGSILMRYGVEGENMYFDEEGKPHYNDGILDSPEGSGTEIGKYTIWPGGGAPQWVNDDNCEAIASEATLKAQEALDPCLPEQIYAAPLLEQEVSDRLSVLWTDLESYMKETTAKLIRGELNFESDWDTYVETMNKIGLEEWVSIYQAAYDVIGE